MEMNRNGFDKREIRGLFPGEGSAPDEELADFLEELRALYVRPVPREVEAAHLATMMEAARDVTGARAGARARSSDARKERMTMTRVRLALLAAGVAAAVPLSAVGLAAAGVGLPDVAQVPLADLPEELPDEARADEVHAVIDATTAEERGCAFGQEVATAASQGAAGPPEGDPCAGEESGSEARNEHAADERGEAASAPEGVPVGPPALAIEGREFGEDVAGQAQEGPSGREFGEGAAEDASDLGAEPPGPPVTPPEPAERPEPPIEPPAGPATGVEQSGFGQEAAGSHRP
jgi:hypothetical protein